ncbi:helix-turn-helix domain-containing protein [Microbacterium sp. ARD31]|uniref:PucR family transcriptional regulator n=1 Tax=Microbacterium sp. ARD31 TaxID=2962576 RepID=UPI002881AB79|nr:helix-turn-helix domain-containing protein [Microbacterium sp. ARD31]MDT0186060.1 helix-turn-helix domain-containing protein [Microbacterium sp. ARD31]
MVLDLIRQAQTVTIPGPPASSVRIEGVPATEWVLSHRRDLVDTALAELRDSVVGGDTERAAQLRWIMDYNVGLFARVFSGQTVLDEGAASELVASAAVRAAEGFPVENLLETYVGGTAAIWRRMASHARADELGDLIILTGALFDYLRGVMALVVRGFEREASRVRLGERDARYAVYSALLAGGDLEQAATRSGLPIAARYLVLAIHIGEESSDSDLVSHVTSARRGNALLRTLDELSTGEVLAVIGDPHGTALIPVTPEPEPDEADRVRAAVERLVTHLGVAVHAGAFFAAASEVRDAVSLAEEVLQLVLAIDFAAGAWFLEDVLLPFQLTRPGPARDMLRDRLEVVEQHPDWEATLRAASRNGWDRTRTARELHVHPNTVDYRLRRMAEATGLDTGDAAQRAAVLAAMYVRAIEAGRTPKPMGL